MLRGSHPSAAIQRPLSSASKPPEVSANEEKAPKRATSNAGYRLIYQALGILDQHVLRKVYPASKDRPYSEGDLGGDAYWGRLWELFREDGRGLDQIIQHATTITEQKQNARGFAWWSFGPKKKALLVTLPKDIEGLLKQNLNNLLLRDKTGQFEVFFGPKNIFSSAYGSKNWQHLRHRFMHTLIDKPALKAVFEPMQKIIDQHLQRIREAKDGLVKNAEELAASITMDMIGKLKLGLEEIDEASKHKVSEIISQAVVEVANPWQKLLGDYVPLYNHFSRAYRYFSPSKLDTLLKAGYTLLRRDFIEPNKENILKTTNWLNPEGKGSKVDLNSQDTIYDITQFLVAGHETTAKLVLLSLLLLGDSKHAEVLEKLRAEVAEQKLPPREWGPDQLDKMPYLDAVVNEVLRLYPPIPDILFGVEKKFSLDGIKANAGDTFIVSPRITHRSKAIWDEDAEEFKPERFLGKKYSEYQFFPFGFAPRKCVGRLFSLQEAKLLIVRMITEFDFSHELHHPFPFHQVFTMRMDLHNIQMRFEERRAPQAAPAPALPHSGVWLNLKLFS